MKYFAEIRDFEWYRNNVPCLAACPVHTDSGKYVQLISENAFKEAYLVARSPNPIASICGRVCAAPCEDACRRGKIDEPVSIRGLKRFVTERYGPESSQPDTEYELYEGKPDAGSKTLWHLPHLVKRQKTSDGFKVAIIGSGPAGLACAHDLALMGYHVTIFEATSVVGGMMRLGIPEYRLPRGVIEKEVAVIQNLGVEIKLNAGLHPGFGLKELKQLGYDAIFLGVGAMKGRDLKLPGSDLDGVVKAIEYLLNVNRGYRLDLGKKVVVIGGGSVALDAARTAIRQFYQPMEEIERAAEAGEMHVAIDVARSARRGGAEVVVASLETFEEMPAAKTMQGKEELHEAMKEGIKFVTGVGPKQFLSDNGHLKAIEFLEVERLFDEQGRFNPVLRPGTEKLIEADSAILAIGQQTDLSFLTPEDGVEVTPQGSIKIDPETLQTTAPGIFSGGDVAFGPRILIEAAANGKRAAQSIDQYLRGKKGEHVSFQKPEVIVTIEELPIRNYQMPFGYEHCDRLSPPTIPSERRTGITEVEVGYTEEEAVEQAQRCLYCHVQTVYDSEKCILCGGCVDVCPEYCLKIISINDLEMNEEEKQKILTELDLADEHQLSVMLKDDDKCIRCGLCAIICPTNAITMEKFSFDERPVMKGEENV